jgi:hypothetical protein
MVGAVPYLMGELFWFSVNYEVEKQVEERSLRPAGGDL